MQVRIFIFLLILSAMSFQWVSAQETLQGCPYIKNYTSADFKVGGAQIFCWAQDNRGMVYVGDMGGILEFNGKEWTRIHNLNNSVVRSMATDSLGIIYAGCSNDFGFLQPNEIGKMEFVSLSKPVTNQGIKFHDIWKVIATPKGIYFCANNYIFRYLDKKISVIPVDYLVQDTYYLNNELYLPTKRGLCLLNDTVLKLVSPKVSFNLISWRDSEFLSVNGDGRLHIFNLKTSEIKEFKTRFATFFKSNPLCEIVRIDENKFAVATETNKILIFTNTGEIIQFIGQESGLMKGAIYKLFVDNDKNLWVCNSKGISKIDINFPVLKFGENQNVDAIVISSCLFKGKKYIATVDGIYYLPQFNLDKPDESQRFIKIKTNSEEFWDFMVFDNQLYAISSYGLWLINDTKAKCIYRIEIPQKAHCFGTSPLFPNVIFIGLRGNMFALKLNNSKNFNTIKVIDEFKYPEVTEKIRHITSDKDGNLWLNTQFNGIYFVRFSDENLRNCHITLLGKRNGLPNLDNTQCYKVNNEVIIATDSGLLEPVFQSNKNEPDSLICFRHSKIFGDSINEANAIVAPISENKYLIASTGMHYALINKMKQAFDSSGFSRMSFALENMSFSSDSIISFCSPDGLFNYNTKNHRNFRKPFNTIISKVIINTDSTLFGGCFYKYTNTTKVATVNQTDQFVPKIDYKYNSLTFHFSALFYEDPEVSEFQYQLVGYNKKFSKWSTESKAIYTNLKEGKYTFRVKAKNAYCTESNVAEYRFIILAPWYRSWWAYLIYTLLFIAIIYLAIRLYTRRLMQQKQYLEQVIEERTSEIREQAKEVRAINEKLVEMDKFKRGITSMIVHDLKNPINAVINIGNSNPEAQLERIKQTGRQMLNLVMNILDVSKWEEAQIQLNIENHHLLGISQRAVEQLLFLSREKSIVISNNIKPELGIRADEIMIERVFVNILSNAIKYTPNNGSIIIDAEANKVGRNGFTRISITDNGIGIPADKIHLVFQKFGQVAAKNSGSVRSTGLGLTFCKMAVEAHEGEIGVDTVLGKGSTFWFTLPTLFDVDSCHQQSPKDEAKNDPQLSETNRALLKVQLAEFQKTEFYKITELFTILESIDDSTNEEIKAWKQALISAIELGNEILYKKLL